jgi:hypothetical protein
MDPAYAQWVNCLRQFENTRKPMFQQPKFEGYVT